jgi:hypothetical protein
MNLTGNPRLTDYLSQKTACEDDQVRHNHTTMCLCSGGLLQEAYSTQNVTTATLIQIKRLLNKTNVSTCF